MASFKSYVLKAGLHWMKAKRKGEPFTLQEGRIWLEKAGRRFPPIPNTKVTQIAAHGIPGEWVTTPASSDDKVLLFFHGGAYAAGSLHSHRGMASRLAEASKAKALSIDYRLAPEHPFPAGLDDAVTSYRWLLRQVDASQIILVGDSAGGGMALATLLKLKEENIVLPAAAALICPWLDLHNNDPAIDKIASNDPVLYKSGLDRAAQMYAQGQDLKNPYISPLFGNLESLPPLLVQVASHDMISRDGIALAEKVKALGGKVQLENWKRMVHVWHFFGEKLPEAIQAIQQIGEFADQTWNAK